MSDEWKAPVDESKGDCNSWKLLEKTLLAGVQEQRRARRWGIFFKLLTFIYLFGAVALFSPALQFGSSRGGEGSHTAVTNVRGMIADEEPASADNVVGALRDAFEDDKTKGVVLRINSPGGSPVQSDYVYREIKRLRALHKDIPVHAVIVDVGASGAYYIASAADNIYADKASLVGSIGVIMNGFGFTEAMDKLGVERRLLTAGEHKGFLDPFSPVNEAEVVHTKGMLANLHQQFINVVKNGRGDRLVDDEKLFSGYIWSGEKSLELGLIDGLGSSSYVAREIIGEEKLVDYTIKPTFIDRFADRLGASMGTVLANTVGLKNLQLR